MQPPDHRELLRSLEARDREIAGLKAEVARLQVELRRENDYLKDEIKSEQHFTSLVGESPAMQQVRRAVLQVARTDSTVLILGETGTGKELIARAIHKISSRRDRLLVKVNCAALSPGVVASELFGHEAGAFTGVSRRRLGRFEIAHQGSIFLDEIAEVPAEVQVLLLRVLQERTFERVGGNDPIAVDVRVIAAMHRDLPAGVAGGRFRADLYYRLNVFPIRVPPLRERKEDIPALADHLLRHFSRRMNRSVGQLAPGTLDLLLSYGWPGNVRELENILERALIVAADAVVHVDPTWLSSPTPVSRPGTAVPLSQLERDAILEALQRCRGKICHQGNGGRRAHFCSPFPADFLKPSAPCTVAAPAPDRGR